jgi:hypothetical protein
MEPPNTSVNRDKNILFGDKLTRLATKLPGRIPDNWITNTESCINPKINIKIKLSINANA